MWKKLVNKHQTVPKDLSRCGSKNVLEIVIEGYLLCTKATLFGPQTKREMRWNLPTVGPMYVC